MELKVEIIALIHNVLVGLVGVAEHMAIPVEEAHRAATAARDRYPVKVIRRREKGFY